jgi:hypothetical protein
VVDEILLIIGDPLLLLDVVSVRLEILPLAVQGNPKLGLLLLEYLLDPASYDHANLDQVGDLPVGAIQIGLVNPALQAIIKTANRLTIATSAALSWLEDLGDLSSDNDTAVESLIGLLDEHDEESVEGDPRLL